MATNTNLSGVFTTDVATQRTNNIFISTENVVGLIFDTSGMGGLTKALGTDTEAASNFANGNVVELNDPQDVAGAGIDENVLAGVAKYHLDTFFTLAGKGKRMFVSFMDSSSDTEFEAVEKMQLASGGIIYQIGVWTGKTIASKNEDSTYIVDSDNICSKLENVAESLGGKVNVTNYDGNAPVNILLNAPIIGEATVDITKLPDLNVLDFPKVSVLLGQAATDEVHELMYAVNHLSGSTASYATVGNIGAALACLAIAPANESIGHVANFNLAAVMQEAELGFGKLEDDTEGKKYKSSSSFTNIKTLNYKKRNAYLHKKGFIFLTNYDGEENSVYFSGDQTLSTGDYRSINRCRVMHKSRRIVRRVLLPYVNGNVEVNTATGRLTSAQVTIFQNAVINALDANMVEPGGTKSQIAGRTCTIDNTTNMLETDEIKINYTLNALGISGVFNVTEGFASVV